MSAASRKNDPFNFDEIYKQAGVEDLFVKKTLGELKQKKPAPGPVPPASPARAAPAPASAVTQNASNFDLDFLSQIATPSGTPPHLSKHNSTTNLEGAGKAQPSPPQQPLGVTTHKAVLDDPFSLFQEVPGAAPAQRHAPPPAPAAPNVNSSGNLLDFDDGGAFSHPAPKAAAPAPPPAAATATPPAAPVAARRAPPVAAVGPLTAGLASSSFTIQAPTQLRPAAPEPVAAFTGQRPSGPQQQPAAPPPPPPDYDSHAHHWAAPPGPTPYPHPNSAGPVGASGAPPPCTRTSDGNRSSGGGGSYVAPPLPTDAAQQPSSSYPLHPGQPHSSPQPVARPQPRASALPPNDLSATNSSSGSYSWGYQPASSGISGVLKAFGKKAVRAAKAGLASLEHALEGLEQQQHANAYGQAPAHAGAAGSFGGGRSHEEGPVPSNDEALAWAVRLADLPPHAQQQELANMAPPLRRKVIEVLREQIRSEHEGAAGLGPGHGGPPPYTAVQDGGVGVGHAAAVGPRRQPRSSDDTGRPQQPQSQPQPQPPSYSDAGRQVTAAAPAAAVPSPRSQQHETHDLLVMDSGGLASPRAAPAAAAPTVPVAAATPAPPRAPVVEDLLGLGDGPGPAPTSSAAARAAPPTAPAPTTAPPVPSAPAPPAPSSLPTPTPPPPPQPAAVHVDDMDDFFAGGKTATTTSSGAARAPSVSMHPSPSAPNLSSRGVGGGGAAAAAASASAVSGASSAVGLADMLHDDDLGGLGGADVDVSGYQHLYTGEQGSADEPELRKRLRAQREAAKHAKMKAALAEKLALEAEEAARREQQVVLKDQYKTDIETWKNRHNGNIRGLLGTLHTVLWPDSGWTPVSVGDLLEPVQVKKVYMKANLLVHPDKVRQRSGSADQVAIADMIFDVLKEAWNAFR